MRGLSQCFARAGATLTLLGVAVGMSVLAVAFLSAALYLALIAPLGAPLAALATGGALLGVSGLLVFAVRFWVLAPRRPAAAPDGRVAAAKLGEMLGEEAGAWTKRHPGAAVVAALTAGFVVGSSPKLRNLVTRLLP